MKNRAGIVALIVCVVTAAGISCGGCASDGSNQSTAKATSQEAQLNKASAQEMAMTQTAQKKDTQAPAVQATPAAAAVSAPQKPAKPVKIAPDFKLQDTYYDMISLGSYKEKGRAVLLFFWTTWCPFCRSELPVLRDRYPVLSRDGMDIVAVNVGESMQKVTAFLQGYNLAYKVLLDDDTTVSNAYQVMGVPTYILINAQGEIVFQDNSFPEGYKSLLAAQNPAK